MKFHPYSPAATRITLQKVHGLWLHMAYEETERSVSLCFFKLVYKEPKSAIIHIRMVNPAVDCKQIFKWKRPKKKTVDVLRTCCWLYKCKNITFYFFFVNHYEVSLFPHCLYNFLISLAPVSCPSPSPLFSPSLLKMPFHSSFLHSLITLACYFIWVA